MELHTSPAGSSGLGQTGRRAVLRLAYALALVLLFAAYGLSANAEGGAASAGVADPAPRLQHGIAMHGSPALPPGFAHFPYVDPDAPKGGTIRFGATGSFDSLNPFIIKGQTPPGLREYVFESLLARSADEPFTLYGLIAGSIEVPDDRSTITFHLRPEARFSDGRPIKPADVVFSHKVLAAKGWPYHRSHYGKVAKVEIVGPHAVRFTFGSEGDRELPLILGLMPVLPSHILSDEAFDVTTLSPPVGSGPYRVTRVDPGQTIIYQRDPNYWGAALSVRRGQFNFDEIRYEFYREQTSLFEAFKAGEIDVRLEDDPGRWAEGYAFPAVKEGRVIKREIPTGLPAGMTGLAFNTRRAPFDNPNVRRAFLNLFDAEWLNRSLYHGLYTRTDSFFARSELASTGRPADARERELLAPFPGAVREDIMTGDWQLPRTDGSGRDRSGLKRAYELLLKAGYRMTSGGLRRADDGRPLSFEFLAASRGQERLMLSFGETLKRLGVEMRIRQVDSAQYWSRVKSFDFDMVQWTWASSLSPGNEQINRWSSKAADIQGTLNYPGVKSKAADAMIDALLTARERSNFVSAVRALDRVLLSGDYVIPLFYPERQWLAFSNRLAMPARVPLSGVDFETWWVGK